MIGPLCRVVEKDAASLPLCYRLVLSHIFAPNKNLEVIETTVLGLTKKKVYTPLERDHLMTDSLEAWGNKTAADREKNEAAGFEDPAHDWEWDMCRGLCKMLIDAEKGLLDKTKWLIKEHGLDYRKIYRLKEAYTAEGIAKAEAIYADYFKKNQAQETGGL